MAGHIATSRRDDWCTPKHIVDAVHRAFGGPPDLDPASNTSSIVGARRALVLPPNDVRQADLVPWVKLPPGFEYGDGLRDPWEGKVFCNPPFGRGLDQWVSRVQVRRGEVILLIPAATDTKRWRRHVVTASRICFLRGRVRYVGAPASAPFATCLAYWGRDPESFHWAFEDLGWVVTP
jgi:hypothetical protein